MASSSNPNSLIDHQATIDGSKFSYFDTRPPKGKKSYETYLFFHGLCHNKWTWRHMEGKKADSVRMIAFTLRGYEGTSSFDKGKSLQNHEIGPILGRDFISIVNYVVDKLGVLEDKGSSLSVVAWSLAAASVVAGYGTLDPASAGPYPKWTSYISRIVFYEPAGARGFFLEQWTQQARAAKKPKTEQDSLALPGDALEKFKKTASRYYKFSEGFFAKPHSYGILNGDDFYQEEECLAENSQLWKLCADGTFERPPMDFYARLLYRKSQGDTSGSQRTKEEEKELDRESNNKFVRDALIAMAKTDVKRIQGVSTKWTLPACVLAVEWLRDVVKDVSKEKFLLTWIEGRYNHYVHNIAPDCLWEVLRKGEV